MTFGIKSSYKTEEDPKRLSPVQWIMRGLRLPLTEIVRRILRLAKMLSINIWKIRRFHKIARAQGKQLHCIIRTERLGDIIAAESTVRALREPNGYYVWLVRDRFADLLKFASPIIDSTLTVSSYTEAILLSKIFKNVFFHNLHEAGYLCNIFGINWNNTNDADITVDNYYCDNRSLCDVIALIGTGRPALSHPRIYPDPVFNTQSFKKEIFAKTDPVIPLIVIHPVSDEIARSWSSENCLHLTEWILHNTNANILEVGLTPVLTPGPRVYCLRNSLTLSQQLAAISAGDIFIGVDSGFSHIANASGVPSILLLGKFCSFNDHMPWKLNKNDIVLRSRGRPSEIEAQQVISALKNILDSHAKH